MWDFNIGQALGLMMRTLPFVLLRAAVYFGITLAYILATGTGVGIGWGVGAFGDDDFRAASMAWREWSQCAYSRCAAGSFGFLRA